MNLLPLPQLRSLRGFASRPSPRATQRQRRDCRPCLDPLESRRLLTSTTLFEFPITNTGASPGDIAAAPDGNLWFTEEVLDNIGVFNPSNGSIAQLNNLTAGIAPQGITTGPDGNLWFTEAFGHNGNGQIAMINSTTHALTEFPALPNAASYPTNIVAGPDGNLWVTETSVLGHKAQIGMINPTTHAISEIPLPNPNSQPFGITVGPDGNLWFAESNANQIGMINPTTHAISEFAVPTPNAQPFRITAGADGNLWFTEENKNNNTQTWQLGMINPTTHTIQEVPLPNGGFQPISITSGRDGNLWFTGFAASGNGAIWAFNPVTHGFTDWQVKTANSNPYDITPGPGGDLYLTERGSPANSIGEVAPALHLSVTSQPPAFVPPGSGFGLTVTVNYDSGLVDTAYNGPVIVALLNPAGATLGGTLTVTAKNGVATFSGLTIDRLGTAYRLEAYIDPLTTTLTAPITVDVPPTIITAKVLHAGKGRHKHIVGFELDFSKALDPARAQSLANYAVTQTVKPRGRGQSAVKAVDLSTALNNATTDSVTLTLAGKAAFASGGQIVVNASSPGGITDTLGDYLDGTGKGVPGVNATLVIAPKARGITLVW